jgi:hypothetical protein
MLTLGSTVHDCLLDTPDMVECIICQERVSQSDITQLQPCGHTNFCVPCIEIWLAQRSTCPMCRGEVLRTDTQGYIVRLPNTGVPAWAVPIRRTAILSIRRRQDHPHAPSPNGQCSPEPSWREVNDRSGVASFQGNQYSGSANGTQEDWETDDYYGQEEGQTDDDYYDDRLADQLDLDVEEPWDEEGWQQTSYRQGYSESWSDLVGEIGGDH